MPNADFAMRISTNTPSFVFLPVAGIRVRRDGIGQRCADLSKNEASSALQSLQFRRRRTAKRRTYVPLPQVPRDLVG